MRQQKGAPALLLVDTGVGSGTRGLLVSVSFHGPKGPGVRFGPGTGEKGGGGGKGGNCLGTEGSLDSEGERGWPGRWI